MLQHEVKRNLWIGVTSLIFNIKKNYIVIIPFQRILPETGWGGHCY
jgi:hypothetical protein